MADRGLPPFLDADTSAANELIVATEHVGFVEEMIGSHIRVLTTSRRLGLARVEVSTAAAAKQLRKVLRKTPAAHDVQRALSTPWQRSRNLTTSGDGGDRSDPIAEISTALRALAAIRHGGWMPTVGRNRLVSFPDSPIGITGETSYGIRARGSVGPAGETSYGGGGLPRPIPGSQRWSPPSQPVDEPGGGIRVGVLDTGIWPHPWLAGSWRARPSDVLPPQSDLGLVAGHGTFVAGLVLSQAPGATIDVRRVLDLAGQGQAWDVAEAIAAMGQSGVSVLNLSFSCYTGDGQPPLVLARAIDRVDPGVVVVAAAGNHAAPGELAALPAWPAALDDVVAVGALDGDGRTASFSPDRPWVDVATLGVDLRSTFPDIPGFGLGKRSDGSWAQWSGTSFSTALVSGAIAAGTDAERYSATEAWDDLLAVARVDPAGGKKLKVDSPRRLRLHTKGWARGSRRSRR
ncbi:MAG TPA: S8/S53 family peptidase [Microlunatus sp.]|nr:S8/S53 family peptidase [Microlunatus sp.]